jgi:P27 family predicted phage terminase small subunit
MKPGTKPTPTALKLIKGNPGRRPLPKREPKPRRGIPPCPEQLDARARAEWERITPELYAAGILTTIDGAVLAAYCTAYSRYMDAEDALDRMRERDRLNHALMIKTKNDNAIQNPLVGVSNRAMMLMLRFAAEFGMTPAARAHIIEALDSDGNEPDKAERYF